MLLEEIAAMLGEINADTNLPMKSEGEVDRDYVKEKWPELIPGITNFMLDSKGKRRVGNITSIKEQGFHAFAMNRSINAGSVTGRVGTDKGIISIY